MGLFDSFLDTASKGFSWLSDNKAALDLVAGAAKGYGAYMSNKQQNKQYDLLKRQFEDQLSRGGAPSDYNSGDFTVGSGFNPGKFLDGGIAQAPGVQKKV